MKEKADLIQALEELQDVPARDPAVVQQNRAAFLREAEDLSRPTVSVSPFMRLIGRFTNGQPRLQFSTLTIGIILGILMLTFSSGVYAARKSAPSQLLYPVKLWLEDSRMAFTRSPHEQLDLRLAYAEERLHEISGFAGELADPSLATALHNFDEQYSAIQSLSGEQELDDVQKDRIEKIQQQYQLIYPEEDEESSDKADESDDSEDRPDNKERNDHKDDPDNDSEDAINPKDTPEYEGGETKTPEAEDEDKSPNETPEPDDDSEDESDDEKKSPTPEPDPTPDDDEKDDSENNHSD